MTDRIRAAIDAVLAGAIYDADGPVGEQIRFNPDELDAVARLCRSDATRDETRAAARAFADAEMQRVLQLAQRQGTDFDPAQMRGLQAAFALTDRMDHVGPRTYTEGSDGALVRRWNDDDLY